MQVKINRAVIFGGQQYMPGAHDVTIHDSERWFFDALLADGQIEVAETLRGAPKEPEATQAAPAEEKPRKRANRGA